MNGAPYIRTIAVLLLVILVLKDTVGLPFPNMFRGLIQALCLLYGGLYVLGRLSALPLTRYWPIFGYLAALLISALFSDAPVYVFMQTGSLMAVALFAIAYFESSKQRLERSNATLIYVAVALYLCACLLSLGMLIVRPDRAYEVVTVHRRFRGLFAEPGMMANAAGILVGLAIFGIRQRAIKLAGIAVGATCLALAMSRTNWLAAFLAACATSWLYHGSAWRKVVGTAVILALAGWLIAVIHGPFNMDAASRIARMESLSTLSGRTELWQASMRAFLVSPVFGNGFTTGVDVLIATSKRTEQPYLKYMADLEGRHGTVHNGYLQSMLDSGVVGTFFYVAVIFGAWYRLLRRDVGRRYPAMFYLITYAAIANAGKNFVYAASVGDSVLFWIVAMFALGAPTTSRTEPVAVDDRGRGYRNFVTGERPRILA